MNSLRRPGRFPRLTRSTRPVVLRFGALASTVVLALAACSSPTSSSTPGPTINLGSPRATASAPALASTAPSVLHPERSRDCQRRADGRGHARPDRDTSSHHGTDADPGPDRGRASHRSRGRVRCAPRGRAAPRGLRSGRDQPRRGLRIRAVPGERRPARRLTDVGRRLVCHRLPLHLPVPDRGRRRGVPARRRGRPGRDRDRTGGRGGRSAVRRDSR